MSETISGIQLTAAGEEALDHAARLLAGVEGGVEKAVRRAAGKAAARLRRANVQAVRERYAISAANIRENENVQVSYSYDGGVQAYVRFSGARIPLFRFDGAAPRQPAQDAGRRVPVQTGAGWRLMAPGLPASGHVLKATAPYQFAEAFVARMSSGHTGIFERTGGRTANGRDEIQELYGPSVPQMLGSQTVAETLAREAMGDFAQDLDRAVLAILSGY